MRSAVGVLFVMAAAMGLALGGGSGCHEGNGLGAADMTTVDMVPPADLVPQADLLPPPNCGKIVFCALGCLGGGLGGGIGGIGGGGGGDMSGANPIGCVLGCGQGAPQAEVTAALSLIACAAQHCLSSDGGTGNQLGILMCLQMSCPSQLSACHGLGIGG